MNVDNSDRVLVKELSGKSKTYYLVKQRDNNRVTLTDLGSGAAFEIDYEQLQKWLDADKLRVANIADIPKNSIFGVCHAKTKSSRTNLAVEEEIERRFSYVERVLQSECNGYTEKWLKPLVKEVARKLIDSSPPSNSTLIRWIKAYISSGCEKSSLAPAKSKMGNRKVKMSLVLSKVLDLTILKYKQKSHPVRYADIYIDFQKKVSRINEYRAKNGEDLLETCSYQTLVKRYKKQYIEY